MEGIVNIHGVIGKIKGKDGKVQEPNVTLIDVIQQVESQKEATTLTLDIKSLGGLVEEADKIYNYLKSIPATINTRTSEVCASAAIKLFLLGEKREIIDYPEFMIHNPFGQPKGGDADYLEAYSKALRALENDFVSFYSSATGTSKEAIRPLMKKETFLSPSEAISFGFATHHTKTTELQAVAYSNKLNLNQSEMSKENSKEVDAKVNSILEKITNFLTGNQAPQAKLVQDANGAEIDFPELEADDTPAVGDKATIDGSPADGERVMPSGETYVFVSGQLEEIKPAEETEEDVEALKAERDALKEQLEAQNLKVTEVQAEAQALKTELDANQEGLKEIRKEIKALKSSIGSDFNHDSERENFEEPKATKRKI